MLAMKKTLSMKGVSVSQYFTWCYYFLFKGGNANRSIRTSAREIEDGAGWDKKHASQARSLRKVCGDSTIACEIAELLSHNECKKIKHLVLFVSSLYNDWLKEQYLIRLGWKRLIFSYRKLADSDQQNRELIGVISKKEESLYQSQVGATFRIIVLFISEMN